MKDYLDKNELESIYQAGYKENNSCETMLLTLYDKLYHDYDTNKAQILIALDYSAAFDCLNQDQLEEVLNEEFGVEQDALKVLHSYFKERRYTIEINQHKSKEQKLTIGSGQGSVMSSMGFSLDVNQLSIIPKKHEQDAYQYADDVSIRFSFDQNEDFETVPNIFQTDLNFYTRHRFFCNIFNLLYNRSIMILIGIFIVYIFRIIYTSNFSLIIYTFHL